MVTCRWALQLCSCRARRLKGNCSGPTERCRLFHRLTGQRRLGRPNGQPRLEHKAGLVTTAATMTPPGRIVRWKPECRPGKGKGEWRRDRGVLGKAQRDAMLAARNETGRPSNARGALRHSKIALRRGDECARARGARLRGAKARRQNPSTGRNRRCQVREQQRKLRGS